MNERYAFSVEICKRKIKPGLGFFKHMAKTTPEQYKEKYTNNIQDTFKLNHIIGMY